jgi:hypothetical protein
MPKNPANKTNKTKSTGRAVYISEPFLRKGNPIWISATENPKDDSYLQQPDPVCTIIGNMSKTLLIEGKSPIKGKCFVCQNQFSEDKSIPLIFRECGHFMCKGAFYGSERDEFGRRKCRFCNKIIKEIALMYM